MRSSDWSSDVCSSDLKTAGATLCRPILAGDIHHSWPIPAGVAAERIALIPPLGDKRDVMRLAPDLCPPSWERVGCQATDVWRSDERRVGKECVSPFISRCLQVH